MSRNLLGRVLTFLCLVLCSLLAAHSEAHTATLSVLVLKERAPGQFTASWEQTQGIKDPSAAFDLLRPVFPEHCRFTPPHLDCGSSGLSGVVGFDGLGDLSSSGLIKIQWLDGGSQLISLTATQPNLRVTPERRALVSFWSVANFIGFGALHIWLGWDHLSFVLGLLWFLDSGPAQNDHRIHRRAQFDPRRRQPRCARCARCTRSSNEWRRFRRSSRRERSAQRRAGSASRTDN